MASTKSSGGKLLSWALAPRHGFEPRFTAPKAAVLPLDDRGSCFQLSIAYQRWPAGAIPYRPARRPAPMPPGAPSCPLLPRTHQRLVPTSTMRHRCFAPSIPCTVRAVRPRTYRCPGRRSLAPIEAVHRYVGRASPGQLSFSALPTSTRDASASEGPLAAATAGAETRHSRSPRRARAATSTGSEVTAESGIPRAMLGRGSVRNPEAAYIARRSGPQARLVQGSH
jgi:hypothetical protein